MSEFGRLVPIASGAALSSMSRPLSVTAEVAAVAYRVTSTWSSTRRLVPIRENARRRHASSI
jgi:hypothetical protein